MSWPFVGRQDELEFAIEAMGDPGTGGIVIAGAAGVGKTRLGLEALDSLDQRRVLARRVVATRALSAIPFGALAPLLPAQLPSVSDRINLLGLVADALVAPAGARRLVLEVDDAHLLDDMSAALVQQLVRAGSAFVMVLVRSGQPAPEPIVALWQQELVARLELQALSELDVKDVLLAALGGQVDGETLQRLWAATRGNTLLLRELVGAGLERGRLTAVEGVWRWEGPWVVAPRLAELISERLGRLDGDEQAVLELLAYGEPLGADLLARLVPLEVMEAVEGKGLLWVEQEGSRAQVRLAHPLYGEVLRAGCPRLRARRRQRELAEVVEAAGARRLDDWLRIAVWRLDSGASVRPEVLVATARQAWACLDLRLAERLARAAFEAGDELAAGQVLWPVLMVSRRNAEAEEVLARLADAPVTDQERAELAIGRAHNLFWGLDEPSKAAEVLAEANTSVTDPGWRDELAMLQAIFLAFTAQAEAALRAVRELDEHATASARVKAQVPLVGGLALSYLGRPDEAIVLLDQARPLVAPWVGKLPWLGDIVELAGCNARLLAGQLTQAAEMAAGGYARAVDRGWEVAIAVFCIAQTQAARMQGHVQEALRWLREGLGIHRRQGATGFSFVSLLLGELAYAEALAGNAAAAAAALAEADQTRRRSREAFRLWMELARPWVAVSGGDRQRGLKLALEVAALARDRGAQVFEAMALHDVVRLDAPGKVVGRLQQLAVTSTSTLVERYAAHAAAAAAHDSAALDAAAASFEQLGAELLAAEAFAQAARAYQRAGKADSARRATAHATVLLSRCDGVRTPAQEIIEQPHLTHREREIAKLAAAGLSNGEIAKRLVIAERTVGNHLHQVYAKLGISGRNELAPLLLPKRRDPPRP